ncbi:MAG TPA: hypothetical protein VGG84_04630 [Gemmatimonadaceae bacterium]
MTAPLTGAREHRAGTEEQLAAALLTFATAFFWWRGFRAFTLAGALLFIVALIQLGVHRRYAADARATRDARTVRLLTRFTSLVALIFPALLALRWLGVAPQPVTSTSADVWFGSLLYVLGLMEFVELATLRALNDP